MAKPKVMVALREVESVEGLVTLACQVSSGMAAELIALHVVEVPEPTPLDADVDALDHPGREILTHAQQVAKQFSRQISTQLLRARLAGEAIAGEAKDQGVELVVMGHRKAHSLGEFLLGSTAQYVSRHAPCRVIIQIPAPGRA